jgi:hypothetical protein
MCPEQCSAHGVDMETRSYVTEACTGALEGGFDYFCPLCEQETQERRRVLVEESVKKLNTYAGKEVTVVFCTSGYKIGPDGKPQDFELETRHEGILDRADDKLRVHFTSGERISLYEYDKVSGHNYGSTTRFDRIINGDDVISSRQQLGFNL